jgi:hypothetical protein
LRHFLFVLLLAAPATSSAATVLFYSGDLRSDANVTSCGPSCVLGVSDSDAGYAQYAAVVETFTVSNTSSIDAITYSFGGGQSQTGTAVAEGGFEPYLSLFDGSGNFLASTFSAACPAGANTVGGNCYDTELTGYTLTPGQYEIAITAWENMSFAENNGPPSLLSDGFTGLGNLNGDENLSYGFDVILPGDQTPSAVPEPCTVSLLAAGLAAFAIQSRRKK